MSTNLLAPLYGPLYGSLYLAVVMSTAFYGFTCMQTFLYYVHYRNDLLCMKLFVTVLWVLNTVHEALAVAGVYKYIIAGLLDPISILNDIPELILQVLLTVLVAVTTQGYFVYRIYLFSDRNTVVPFIWTLLALLQIVSATVYVGKALYNADGIQAVELIALANNPFMSLATACFALAAGVDVLIASFLTFLLIRKRTATGYSSTVHVLQRLTLFAVNTGIWTALFALLSIVLLHAFPSNMVYAVFVISLCPVYCNTLLANLNARAYVRGELTAQNDGVDLFTRAISPMSTITRIDKHRRGSKLVTSIHGHQDGIWKTAEAANAFRTTTATMVQEPESA